MTDAGTLLTHTCGRLGRRGRRCPRHAPHLVAHRVTDRGKFAGWQKWRACGRHARRARQHGAARIPPGVDATEFLDALVARHAPAPEAPAPEPRERRR